MLAGNHMTTRCPIRRNPTRGECKTKVLLTVIMRMAKTSASMRFTSHWPDFFGHHKGKKTMNCKLVIKYAVTSCAAFIAVAAYAQDKKPNIVFIMGDDIGMWNIGAYHRGLMAGRTPNLDKMAKEGMLFTDYYAEASCTAGRANFIMGELPIRTGMTTVGQAGAPTGLPAEACTIATALKAQGYATGQFGKNHLGDRNEFLPTVHGFDEFFGYLYHLDAMEDPAHPNYPQNLLNDVGPRNMVHSWATNVDDQTEMPRWGKIGKQRVRTPVHFIRSAW